jgi:hypothetical protein
MLLPDFDEGEHAYKFEGFGLPGASRLMERIGVKEPFDRTFWRQSLMRKGMTLEDAEAYMDQRGEQGIERGKKVHAFIEAAIKEESPKQEDFIPDHLDSIDGYLNGFYEFADQHGLSTALLIERPLIHPICFYCGTVDCLAWTDHGLTIIDWKTSESIKKYKKQKWQLYQQVLYAAAINRCYVLDQPVTQGMSVTMAEDGWRLQHWEPDDFKDAWVELKERIYEFWQEQQEEGQMSEWPAVATRALKAMDTAWGKA